MRLANYLFTFAEMSASVHDGTFVQGSSPLVNSKFIATVQDALNTLNIDPLSGPSNRCPTWDELYPGDVDSGLKVVLTVNGNTLTANAYSGTPPYNFYFYCIPVGQCYQFNISDPNQPNAGNSVSTDFSTTPYTGTDYSFNCGVTDDAGNAAGSNSVHINACLVPETAILMKDLEEKYLSEIKIGDILFDSIITSIETYIVPEIYSINNGLLKTSAGHINILHTGDLMRSSELKRGQFLIDKDFNPIEITSIDLLRGATSVINISTNTATYIANGVRTHNKYSCPT